MVRIHQETRSRTATGLGWVLIVGLVAVALASSSARGAEAQRSATTVKQQLEFGVDMARRGLWSEALFRFRQAERLEPDNPSVFNNLAVAHEAIGLFEEALALYRRGLELAPQDKALRNNYARFIDFYNRFKPDDENVSEAADTAAAGSSTSLADADEPPSTTDPPMTTETRAASDSKADRNKR